MLTINVDCGLCSLKCERRETCTHRLADASIPRPIYAAHKDGAGERDVEAEVDQHVPKFLADTDRPAATEPEEENHKADDFV